ncbi:MAG: SPASM domain-containing protein [Candidatus Omnitrophica bacterium]|nr:SPASM domain-containing protein [Candidatus Omnitrophota bacterium]
MLKDIYHKLPYKYSYIVKKAYYFFVSIYYDIRNLILYGTTDMFNDLNIETSTCCTRRCSYCPNSVYDRSLLKNKQTMPEDVFKKVINELAEIHFTGRISPHSFNEPLMDERLADLIAYAHEKLPRAKLELYTNGDLLDTAILDRLYTAGVRHYVITLHGTDEEKKSGMLKVGKLKEYIRQKKYKIKTNILIFHQDTPLDTRAGLVPVNVKRYPGDVSCAYPINPLTIHANGKVVLCCIDYLEEVSFGNVQSERLMDIWNKKDFRDIRKQLKKRIYSLDICKRCTGISK